MTWIRFNIRNLMHGVQKSVCGGSDRCLKESCTNRAFKALVASVVLLSGSTGRLPYVAIELNKCGGDFGGNSRNPRIAKIFVQGEQESPVSGEMRTKLRIKECEQPPHIPLEFLRT